MRLFNISIGNLKRRMGRTLVLAAGLSIGVAMVVSMTGITARMKSDIERKLDEYGANIIVTPRAESLALNYGGVNVADASYDRAELHMGDVSSIMGIENKKNLSAVAPKVIGAHAYEGRSVLVVGVDFPSEFKIKKWWRLEGRGHSEAELYEPPRVSDSEVVLGHSAASSLALATGSKMDLGGRSYTVKGVLGENASQDDGAVFMAIGEAQRLLGKEGAVSMIEVSALCSDCPIEDIVAQIGAALPHARVSAVRQAMTLRMQTAEQMVRFSIAVSMVVLAIGSLIVFVSMLSSVNERTREIGVLRAIGFRRSHILKVILMEASVVSLGSGIIGWAVGSASVSFLAPRFAGSAGLFLDPMVMLAAPALALLVGMTSSLYPAVKASNLEPLEALRYI